MMSGERIQHTMMSKTLSGRHQSVSPNGTTSADCGVPIHVLLLHRLLY